MFINVNYFGPRLTSKIWYIVHFLILVKNGAHAGCLSGEPLYDSRQPRISFSASPHPYISRQTNVTLTCQGWAKLPDALNYMDSIKMYKNDEIIRRCQTGRFDRFAHLSCSVNVSNIDSSTLIDCGIKANLAPCNVAVLNFTVHDPVAARIVGQEESFDINTLTFKRSSVSYPSPVINWILNDRFVDQGDYKNLSVMKFINKTIHTNSVMVKSNNDLPLKIQCSVENEVNKVYSRIVYAGFIEVKYPDTREHSIEINWRSLLNNSRQVLNISSYTVFLRNKMDNYKVQLDSNVSRHIFRNLTSGYTYIGNVIATADNGDKLMSKVFTVTTIRKIKIVDITSKTALVKWHYISQNNEYYLGLHGYQIILSVLNDGSEKQSITVFNNNATNKQLKNLEPGRVYELIIQAVTSTSDTLYAISEKIYFRTLDRLPMPSHVRIRNITTTSAFISWQHNSSKGVHDDLLGFRVVLADGKKTVLNVTTHVTSLTVNGLSPNTTYYVVVNGYSQNGPGFTNKHHNFSTTATTSYESQSPTEIRQYSERSPTWIIVGVSFAFVAIGIFTTWMTIQRRKGKSKILKINPGQIRNSNNPFDVNLDILFPRREKPAVSQETVSRWEIPRTKLIVFKEILGGGQFGIVQKGVVVKSSDLGNNNTIPVAVKSTKCNTNEASSNELLRELEIIKHVNTEGHVNILGLVGACTTTEPFAIVLEYCRLGNLRQLLIQSRVQRNLEGEYTNIYSKLNETQLINLAAGVARGMIYLGEQKVVHRDIASRNIMLDEQYTPKIGDFGLARKIDDSDQYIVQKNKMLPVKWMALESLEEGRFTVASDVWSYGVLLWEICTLGEEPYPKISPYDILEYIRSGERMQKPIHCSVEIFSLMGSCWQAEEAARPGFMHILDTLNAMQLDDKVIYVNVTHVCDEEPNTHGHSNPVMAENSEDSSE